MLPAGNKALPRSPPLQIVAQPPMHNDDLAEFLKQPRPEWSRVRWINLQGLSWDCILVRGAVEEGLLGLELCQGTVEGR